MKKFLALAGLAIASVNVHAAPFTLNSIVVERVGDGAVALSSAAQSIAVLEYNPSGTLLQTLTSEFTGASLQTDTGSGTSAGYLGFGGGQYLAVSGYNSALGTASVSGLNTKVAQVIDTTTGNVVSRVLFPTGGPTGTPPSPFSGNGFRSVVPVSSNTFYASGTASGSPATGGAWFYNGTSFVQVSSTNTGQPLNLRNVEVFNGQLYVSSAAGTGYGIWSIGSGTPTSAAQPATLTINTGVNASPYGFAMLDTDGDTVVDRAYIADDRTSNLNGGVTRWDLVSSVWTQTYAFRLDATTSQLSAATASVLAVRGLTTVVDAITGDVTIYATTTETANNRLISFIDDGSVAAGTSFTTLAQSGSNYAFRGVDINAVPEPSTYAMLALAGAGFAGYVIRRRRR